jgi:hypothetical protein
MHGWPLCDCRVGDGNMSSEMIIGTVKEEEMKPKTARLVIF